LTKTGGGAGNKYDHLTVPQHILDFYHLTI